MSKYGVKGEFGRAFDVGVVKMIKTDNVVYLNTYKLAKQAQGSFVPYKNSYFRMDRAERDKERTAVERDLSRNPQNVLALIKMRAINEVENG